MIFVNFIDTTLLNYNFRGGPALFKNISEDNKVELII